MPDDSSPTLEFITEKGRIVPAPHVRVATADEVHAVMKLALMGCAENEFMPHSEQRVLEDVYAALVLEHGICGVIGPVGGELEAAVLLRIGSIWYSDQPHIEERAIFVHPAYRSARGGRAKRLAEFSMDLADRLGMPLTIGVLSNSRTEAKVRLYQRVLGKPAGAYWIYWPNSRLAEEP
jgi:GNAT superfamily N-acetyltransferase